MPRRTILVLAALATSGLLAACGSSSSGTSTAANSASATRTSNRATLGACLRKHGVAFPAAGTPPAGATPGGNGAPPSGFPGAGAGSSRVQAALKACRASLPPGPRAGGVSRQGIQTYVACVRQHGYSLPNPNLSGTGSVFPASIRSNPKFLAASRACQSLLGGPPGGAPAGA